MQFDCAVALAALLLPGAGMALAGNVITANLPANTAIVNIDARVDGAASYNGPQTLWYQPFSTNGAASLLEYTVNPGSYTFRVVDPADAATLYPALTTAQNAAIFTSWTYNSPWITNYLVFDGAAATNSSLPQLMYGAGSTVGYTGTGATQKAYDTAIQQGYFNEFRTGAQGAASPDIHRTYTFASTETLIFVVPDWGLYDNAGGVSVLVRPALPGDANGDGVINADDYALTDRGHAKGLSGWENGDFNGDGVVNQADYQILDAAYQATHDPIAVVPEPALGLALPALLLLRRRAGNLGPR